MLPHVNGLMLMSMQRLAMCEVSGRNKRAGGEVGGDDLETRKRSVDGQMKAFQWSW